MYVCVFESVARPGNDHSSVYGICVSDKGSDCVWPLVWQSGTKYGRTLDTPRHRMGPVDFSPAKRFIDVGQQPASSEWGEVINLFPSGKDSCLDRRVVFMALRYRY